MKIFVVALLVIAVTARAAPTDDSTQEKNFKECLAENDIKEEEFEQLDSKNDAKIRCVAACVFQKEGIMEDGGVNKDKMVKSILKEVPKVSEADVKKIADMCLEKVKDVTDTCDLTNSLSMCIAIELNKKEA